MWKALVNIVKRCLRTAFGTPGAKRETRVQNPPATAPVELTEEMVREILGKVRDLFEQWKAGTLPPHMLRQPPKPRRRTKRRRAVARPDSVRKTQPHPAPENTREPARPAPPPQKFLRPHALEGPEIFFERAISLPSSTPKSF
jgi:hypothetical protein